MLAQKWQPTRRPPSEERNTKAVDTDMIVVSCVVSLGCHTLLTMMRRDKIHQEKVWR